MKNRTLHLSMLAAAGLLTPAALEGVASADFRSASVTKLLTPSEKDLAPTTGTPARLKRTDENQPGAEMAHLAFFKEADGATKSGLYFEMRSGELNGSLPTNRMQLAMVPFHLEQKADGSVAATPDMTGARFVTNNDGNEYRNANHPIAYTINDGNVIVAEYNVNLGSDTDRYAMAFDRSGKTIMPQTRIFHKNNDNCSMNQDSTSTTVVSSTGGHNHMVAWRGCNGNGSDDGWVHDFAIDCDAGNTKCTYTKNFDVAACKREERSRGYCSVGTDPNTAICSWTEGNSQPQRDGTWLAAIDITEGAKGTDLQNKILWKQQIDGRKGQDQATRTYSMRAMHSRIPTVDASGKLVASDQIFFRSGDVHGRNNGNNKGGSYEGNMIAVIEATRTGMSYKVPLTNMQDKLIGTDGTHLGMTFSFFGTTDKLVPGFTFVSGSHTGGGYGGHVRAVGWDTTANTLNDLGSYTIAPYDRHLYPNYLGNNPGNQGRNFAGADMVVNPFFGQNGNTDKYLMIYTTTGKDPADMTRPELKLSSYISVMPVVQSPPAVTPPPSPNGSGSGTPGGSGSGTPDPQNPDPAAADPGSSLGGCSTSGSTGGAFSMLLVGLAAFIRRRR